MNENGDIGASIPHEDQDTDLGERRDFAEINPPDRVSSHFDGTKFVLPENGKVTLGRMDEQERSIHVPNEDVVSRQHLVMYLSHGELSIVDHDSTNGTWINGQELERQGYDLSVTPAVAKPGDLLVLAEKVFYRIKQEQGRWVLQQEVPPAQKVKEKLLSNLNHLELGEIAFEALPFSRSLAEFMAHTEMSLPSVLPDVDEAYREKVLNKLKGGMRLLIGDRSDVELSKDLSPNNIVMSIVQDIVVSGDQKWSQFAATAKAVINAERASRQLVPFTFDDRSDSLSNILKKEDGSTENENVLDGVIVGEKVFNMDGNKSSREVQDAAFSLENGSTGVFDGMSNAYDGATASRVAKDTYREVLQELPPHPTSEQLVRTYELAASLTIFRLQEERGKLSALAEPGYMDWRAKNNTRGPGKEQPIFGTTLASAMIIEEQGERKAVYSYSGDSRVYVLKKSGAVNCITVDHNLFFHGFGLPDGLTPGQLQERFDNVRDESELANEPELLELFKNRHVITQDLSEATFGGSIGATTGVYRLEADDVGVFCTSDGVHDNLTKDEIQETIATNVNDTQEIQAVKKENNNVARNLWDKVDRVWTGLKRFGRKETPAELPGIDIALIEKRLKDLADRAYDFSQLPPVSNHRAKRDDVAVSWALRPANSSKRAA